MDSDAALEHILWIIERKDPLRWCRDELEGLVQRLDRGGFMPKDELLQRLGELDSDYVPYRTSLLEYLRGLQQKDKA